MKFIIPALASFFLTAVLMPLVIHLAKACRCIDVPGARRLHKKATPRWGGVAFFAGLLPVVMYANGGGALTAYVAASSLLIMGGVVDDLRELGWKIKFAWMAVAATILIYGGGAQIQQVGSYGAFGVIDLGWFSIPFTYLCIIGVTNAINLLDGLDGLAGGVSLIGFLFLGIAAILTGNPVVATVCFGFVGALGGFLLYNFPSAKVFMGDSGSTFLGFSLAYVAICLTQQGAQSVDVLFPVLLLLLPIFDTLWVLVVRLAHGRNPFVGDNSHLHYLIVQRTNVSPVRAVLVLWALTALFGLFALALVGCTSSTYLVIVINAVALLGMTARSLAKSRAEVFPEPAKVCPENGAVARGE